MAEVEPRDGADGGEGDLVDLAGAAGELGVHYQTAYRWVRDGSLRATKVGKIYRVRRTDLERFARRRSSARAPRPLRVRDWDHQVDRLHEALTTGDERAAREVVDRLVAGGVPPVELCDELLAPVLRRVGEEWAGGAISISIEHRATAICERLLARLPSRRTRVRGTAVVATPAGERHALPSLMAAVALRWDGWRVHHLAADLPPGELARFVERERPDLVVLSTTTANGATGAGSRAATGRLNVPVLTGGPGRRLAELVASARDV